MAIDFQLDKEMKRGVAKVVILSHLKNSKTYPYEILKRMKSARFMHGHTPFSDLTKSDMYNLLSSLEKEGFIKGKTVLKGNRAQKNYTLTRKGENVVRNKDKIFMSMISSMKKLVKAEFSG